MIARAAALLASAALAGCAPSAPPEIPAPPLSAASAALHASDPAREAALLQSPVVLSLASQETEDPIQRTRVDVTIESTGRVTLRVAARSEREAVVQCLALLRAADKQRKPEVDAFAQGLASDRDALRREMAGLDKSLREISQDGGAGEPASVQAESVRVKVERMALQQSRTVEGASAPKIAPELLSLAALAVRSAAENVSVLMSQGLGRLHPEVIAARAKADALQTRFLVQLAAEEAWLTALEARLAKEPPSGSGAAAKKARLAALLDVLDGPQATVDHGVASELPLRLRLMAREYEEHWLKDLELSRVYGDRHPRRVVSLARLRSLAELFDRERRMLVAMMRGMLAKGIAEEPGRGDVRQVQLDEVKVRLAHVLVRLDELERDRDDRARVRVVRSCAPSR